VQSGEWPAQETRVPLFPYQREGMLHLAFNERALLADEMGLGKTIQAIAASALLHRLGQARRVLVVTPASLKTEWEEQIQRFTPLSLQLVFGPRPERIKAYNRAAPRPEGPPTSAEDGPFFTIVNYEQMLADALEVNERIRPDIVILDEAQRIKNWSTKTTQAIKRLRSRYAFVLTGTPIENRLDELYSIMDFLNPHLLGPLFRFNRDHYQLDDRGRPSGYRNLDRLQERIRPYLLRRRKADVETELPERTDRQFMVGLTPAQRATYDDLAGIVAKLSQFARRRPLTQQEQDRLLRTLGMMRMTCDTNYILNDTDESSSKIPELARILEELRDNPGVKVIVFSEWERMLELVRKVCQSLQLGFAWHTGSVPQKRRRAEINAFKTDPTCRVFLSTDSGAAGLNLQNASVVINCDLPWTPAKLEQRIARAWRKHQSRPVTVINLIAENTIEARMLDTLASKQALADGLLDRQGDVTTLSYRSGRQAFFTKLEQLGLTPGQLPASAKSHPTPTRPRLPTDRAAALASIFKERLGAGLLRFEERYPQTQPVPVLYAVVQDNAARWREELARVHTEYFADQGPEAQTRLEIVDRATDEALQRMMDAGLITRTIRVARPLLPADSEGGPAKSLSPEEIAAVAEHRAETSRRLRMAQVLDGSGFPKEAREATLAAALAHIQAIAIEQGQKPPTNLSDSLLPPLRYAWADRLEAVQQLVENPLASCEPVARLLG
jgi:hypothetical protein